MEELFSQQLFFMLTFSKVHLSFQSMITNRFKRFLTHILVIANIILIYISLL